MDPSIERKRSFGESTPLLRDTPTEPVNDRTTQTFPEQSIFTCAIVCILFTELCERLTFYGIGSNLVLFATESDHLGLTPSQASILAYVFSGACATTPIIGGWLADSKFGKFSVILFSTIVYLVGTALLPLGSISRKDDTIEWAVTDLTTKRAFKISVYVSGLFLVSLGTGGIKANVSPFGAEQVSNRGPGAIQAFFSWFYWFINIGALLANTLVVYVQQYESYFWGNLIPALTLILAIIIFLVGKQSYCLRPASGSALATTLSIAKEAIKKSWKPSLSGSFVDHWLDRAKLCYGGSYSSWEVEDVKKVYRLLPIFGTFILYWTVYAQMSTSMIYQGEYMNTELGDGFKIPVASLSLLDSLGILLLIPIVDKLVYPLLGRFNLRPSQLVRVGLGMLIASSSMACAGALEWYRVRYCCISQLRGTENNTQVADITIFAQIPQYTLIGLSEVFTSITGFELAYTEAPKSLQGVIMGVYILTTGLGSYAGAALVGIVNAITGSSDAGKKWYPDKGNINDGHYLAYYFFLLAGVMILNFVLYIFVAASFKGKKESARRANLPADSVANAKQPGVPREDIQDDDWSSDLHTSSRDSDNIELSQGRGQL